MMLRFLKLRRCLRVHLRHHQRNVGVHAEMAGVVDHDAAGRGRARGMDGGDSGAGAEQADVTAGEVERVQIADRKNLFLAKGDFRTGRTAGREGDDFRRREVALRQGFDDLASDRPCGADNRDPVSHVCLLFATRHILCPRGRTVSGPGAKRQAIRGLVLASAKSQRRAAQLHASRAAPAEADRCARPGRVGSRAISGCLWNSDAAGNSGRCPGCG